MEFVIYFTIILWAIFGASIVKGEEDIYTFRTNFTSNQETPFDVLEYGAVGDGKADDSKAFEKTWAAACVEAAESVKISAPQGKKFLVLPIEFKGPCKSRKVTFEILGSIIAQPKDAWEDKSKGGWLKFEGVEGLSVLGNGVGLIDGQGDSWWQHELSARPTAMLFSGCNNLQIKGLKHINSQKFHVAVSSCNNTFISKLRINAPENSPNTDGIDIYHSNNVTIYNCTVQTGDDCIAIKEGNSNLNISEILCGPGHGISIGSLGEGGKYDQVEAISINNCTISGTTNGIRIKTWQGGSGFARNIKVSNIIFSMANNPIIIDQFYCPHKTCSNETSAVKVSDVRFSGLYGTSLSKNPTISFQCSDNVPCRNLTVEKVDITSSDSSKPAYSVCLNAYGIAQNITSPSIDCLQK